MIAIKGYMSPRGRIGNRASLGAATASSGNFKNKPTHYKIINIASNSKDAKEGTVTYLAFPAIIGLDETLDSARLNALPYTAQVRRGCPMNQFKY